MLENCAILRQRADRAGAVQRKNAIVQHRCRETPGHGRRRQKRTHSRISTSIHLNRRRDWPRSAAPNVLPRFLSGKVPCLLACQHIPRQLFSRRFPSRAPHPAAHTAVHIYTYFYITPFCLYDAICVVPPPSKHAIYVHPHDGPRASPQPRAHIPRGSSPSHLIRQR